jgi:hypothetical protein
MKKKPYPLTDLTGGLVTNKDPILLQDKFATETQWVIFEKGIVKKDFAWITHGSVTGVPQKFIRFMRSDSTIYWCLVTTLKFYVWDGATSSWDDMGDLAGNVDYAVSYIQANDYLIFTNSIDPPWKFDGTTLSALANAPICNAIGTFKNRILVGGTTETAVFYPFRVRWSDIGEIEVWTDESYQDTVDTPDWITAFVNLGQSCWMFKTESMWDVQYVGGAGVFDIVKKFSKIGTNSSMSISTYRDTCFFFGNDAVYNFDPVAGTAPKALSDPLFDTLYQTGTKIVNLAGAQRIHGSYVAQNQQYWVVVPTLDSTVPKDIFKLDIGTGAWTRVTGEQITSIGEYSTAELTYWSDLATQDWTQPILSWRGYSLANSAPTMVIGYNDGTIFEDTRSQYDNEQFLFETKDFLFGHAQRTVECRVEAQLGDFTLYYSLNGGKTWSSGKSFVGQPDWKEYVMYLNETTQLIRFRIVSTAHQFELRWIEPWYLERKRSEVLTTA